VVNRAVPESFAMRPLPVDPAVGAGAAFAWGPEGHHQIVAHIAAKALAPARRQGRRAARGDAEAMMVLDSTWADEIRTDCPDAANWHFVNIELGAQGL